MKRFSDTSRFSEPWYSELPPEMKVAWEYIWATCDNSGVWTPNYPLADFQIGKKVDWQKLKELLAGRVSELESGKWFLPDFIKTQCGKLNPESRPHMAVITLLRGHGLMSQNSFDIDYGIDYQRTIVSPKDKDKDQEEDKDKEKDAAPKKNKATLDEVIAFTKELGLPQSDGVSCFHKWEGNGWTNGKAKIVCWKSTIRAWKAAGYLPSQKNNGFAQPQKPAVPLKTRAQFIGEAGSRKMKLLPGEDWPKNPDGSDQTTDQVGNAAYEEYLKAQ